MRIMILPSSCVPDSGSAIILARNLAALFRMENIDTAICAGKRSRFSDVSFYESPSPVSFSRRPHYGTTIEEYMRAHGALSASFLSRDYEAIVRAVAEFCPDLLIEIERPAAIATAKQHNLPVFSLVSPGAFRNRSFRADTMNGLNSFLSSQEMEQVLRLRELYEYSHCFAFGPEEFRSFFHELGVTALGISSIAPLVAAADSKLSIILNDTALSSRKRRKVLTEAFLGAPYDIYIYARGLRPGRNQNLHFQSQLRLSAINESRVCIHDGDDAITNYCLAIGVPQVIIHDDSWQRAWNAACLKRSGAGLTLEEAEFSMSSVYETFRMVVSDDLFQKNAARLQTEVNALGDLSGLLAYL